jgi:hypothetical protein
MGALEIWQLELEGNHVVLFMMMMMINLFICFSAHVTLFVHNTVNYTFPSVHFFGRK